MKCNGNVHLFKGNHRRTGIFWGTVLIIAGLLLLLDGIGFLPVGRYGVTPWRLFLGILCLGWLIREIARGGFSVMAIPAALLFLLAEEPIARLLGREDPDLINNWIVIAAALLISIGLAVLGVPSLKKGKKGGFEFEFDSSRIGSSTLYLDAVDLTDAAVSDIAGSVHVYFSNIENYPGNGSVRISDIAGKVVVHLPADWLVITHVSDCVGRVVVPPQTEKPGEKRITLEISDIAGRVEVVND